MREVHSILSEGGMAIACAHLLDRLVLDAVGLFLVKVLSDVEGVDERDDRVEAREALDILVDEEGLRDGRWVGETCRLDDDVVELPAVLLALHQLHQDRDEVDAHGAADAAIVHLEDVLVRLELVLDERVVHAHLTKLPIT